MAHPEETAVIELRNVWKVFGARADAAMQAIQAEGLSKAQVLERFDCVVGVADASFSVPKAEIFCIMGLSGSGKSTLVRHINRLLEPTSGQILVDGVDIMKSSDEELRAIRSQNIGMVFQNFALLPHRTVRDNVALPLEIQGLTKSERWDLAQKSIDLVELSGWEDKFAHELSGGMQQRVGLARALAADPDVLLMDEAFSALDPLIRRQLQDQFLKLSQEMRKTTIFITHDLDEAIRIGHRIAIMKDGAIVQIGTPDQIITEPADDYVADFVAGISRLKLVYAHSIMQPVTEALIAEIGPIEAFPAVDGGDDLDRIIDAAVAANSPLQVMADGNLAGVITNKDIMLGIQGGKE
ncbi:quaternary amine ABC transporter ATP-binding protein [Roseovarius sp. 2305UL8-3]|uniref:quaternary amine ABC transporter ATP-binding protein n=1 Tax=Roseovarius conchicola TaxID=3121636 RepID=UPI003527300D